MTRPNKRFLRTHRKRNISNLDLSESNILCPVEGKVKFKTREDALESIEASGEWGTLAPYMCMDCLEFHKTKREKTVKTFYRELKEGQL